MASYGLWPWSVRGSFDRGVSGLRASGARVASSLPASLGVSSGEEGTSMSVPSSREDPGFTGWVLLGSEAMSCRSLPWSSVGLDMFEFDVQSQPSQTTHNMDAAKAKEATNGSQGEDGRIDGVGSIDSWEGIDSTVSFTDRVDLDVVELEIAEGTRAASLARSAG